MTYAATKRKVTNRGTPPDAFLDALIAWGKTAPEEIFAPNANPADIFSLIRPKLGPWMPTPGESSPCIQHRKAAMLEAMRVHAGFESSWNWNEGVDRTNATSLAHIEGQETGIFQVSWDSTRLGQPVKDFAAAHGVLSDIPHFIARMKSDHPFALEYYARLVRVSIRWAGPLLHGYILADLSRDAVEEFKTLLAA